MNPAEAFDPAGPLPRGRLLLEASAGTGKTYAIVGLATRFLAEGRCTAEELLVVSFSRSATRELRARLLQRMEGTADTLAGAMAGRPSVDPDVVDAHLLGADRNEVEARLDRLRTALAEVDRATITTIHQFCGDLLGRLGDPALGTLLEDEQGLAREIMSDLYLRIVGRHPDAVDRLPRPHHGLEVVLTGMHHPRTAIRPEPTGMRTASHVRAWIAIGAGLEATSRKAAARVHTYDDLLVRLAAHLDQAMPAVLRDRFTVGLVDEFQDTDPLQWQILSSLFDPPDAEEGPGRTLVLVGDPKQAIYAFRGADIATYLGVRGRRADRTLPHNHRADAPVAHAVTELFAEVPLGEGIEVHPVTPTRSSRLDPAPPPPVCFRVVTDDAPVPTSTQGPRMDPLRAYVAADVADHVVRLLADPPTVRLEREPPRPLGPDDVTVLVRTNAQAATVKQALDRRGVPTVLNGVGNVLDTPAAADWLSVLQALQAPAQPGPARRAALSGLLGWSLADLATAEEDRLDALHVLLHDLADTIVAAGVATTLRQLDQRVGVSARLMSQPGGARRLADLLHVGEVLHAEQRHGGLGLAGLAGWLERAMATAADPPPDRLARRLEQSDHAVQIMTIHGAKGLERGVVLAPFLWDTVRGPGEILTFTAEDGSRLVDVGGKSRDPVWQDRKDLAKAEAEHEELRLAYVAATRARHHLVLWWASHARCGKTPLSIILGRGRQTPDTDAALAHLRTLVGAHPDGFDVTLVDRPPERVDHTPAPEEHALVLGRLERPIDHGWRRYSYSRLTSQQVDHDVEDPQSTVDDARSDLQPDTSEPSAEPDPSLAAPVPLGDMPGGAEVGSSIHRVLERLDFTTDELSSAIEGLLADEATISPVDLTAVEGVADGLVAVLETPLGPLAGDVPLRQLRHADRLDELSFEFPVLSGAAAERPGSLLLADLADVLATHLPDGDPLSGYPQMLRAGLGEVEVRGYLAGQIDLVARVPGPQGPRFLVADYKTNRIVPPSADDLLVGHFHRRAMAEEMCHHHYPLQALLYLVAAHRYLRWRVPDYDPDRHLAGCAYLFLRGMVGSRAPRHADGTPYGVFTWSPPTTLLDAVDDLLARGRHAR